MAKNPPEWAYQRVSELHQAFAPDDFGHGLAVAYGNLKGAFALYIASKEEAPVDPEAAALAQAFQDDGSDLPDAELYAEGQRVTGLLRARGFKIVEASDA